MVSESSLELLLFRTPADSTVLDLGRVSCGWISLYVTSAVAKFKGLAATSKSSSLDESERRLSFVWNKADSILSRCSAVEWDILAREALRESKDFEVIDRVVRALSSVAKASCKDMVMGGKMGI